MSSRISTEEAVDASAAPEECLLRRARRVDLLRRLSAFGFQLALVIFTLAGALLLFLPLHFLNVQLVLGAAMALFLSCLGLAVLVTGKSPSALVGAFDREHSLDATLTTALELARSDRRDSLQQLALQQARRCLKSLPSQNEGRAIPGNPWAWMAVPCALFALASLRPDLSVQPPNAGQTAENAEILAVKTALRALSSRVEALARRVNAPEIEGLARATDETAEAISSTMQKNEIFAALSELRRKSEPLSAQGGPREAEEKEGEANSQGESNTTDTSPQGESGEQGVFSTERGRDSPGHEQVGAMISEAASNNVGTAGMDNSGKTEQASAAMMDSNTDQQAGNSGNKKTPNGQDASRMAREYQEEIDRIKQALRDGQASTGLQQIDSESGGDTPSGSSNPTPSETAGQEQGGSPSAGGGPGKRPGAEPGTDVAGQEELRPERLQGEMEDGAALISMFERAGSDPAVAKSLAERLEEAPEADVDSVDRDEIPRSQRDLIRRYFELLRGGF